MMDLNSLERKYLSGTIIITAIIIVYYILILGNINFSFSVFSDLRHIIFLILIIINIILNALFIHSTNLLIGSQVAIVWISIMVAIIIEEPNVLVAGATIILVIVTGYSIIESSKYSQQNIDILKEQVEPNVVSDYYIDEINNNSLVIKINNIGKGVAKSVKFNIEPPEALVCNINGLQPPDNAEIRHFLPGQEIIIARFNILCRVIQDHKFDEIRINLVIKDIHDTIHEKSDDLSIKNLRDLLTTTGYLNKVK